jgi:inosine/xanthosine triphosphatase
MKIIVGSENPVKIGAIRDTCTLMNFDADVVGNNSNSGVSAQPFSLEEITQGAKTRAKNIFENSCLSVGIESGIFPVNNVHFDTCHVAIYDGLQFYEGGAPYFEIPPRIINKLKEDNLELGDFFDGKGEGAIGVLTRGLISRQQQIVYAATMALSRYINKDYQ